MRIGIDGRKLRDYGIGTYVRNLLRQLSRQDTVNEYVVFCQPADWTMGETECRNVSSSATSVRPLGNPLRIGP